MAITITHPVTMTLCITFDGKYKIYTENKKSIDDVTEIACNMMVEHNFHLAEITNMIMHGVIVKIERS